MEWTGLFIVMNDMGNSGCLAISALCHALNALIRTCRIEISQQAPLCSFGQHAGVWLLLTPTSDRLNTNISKGPTRIAICDPRTITRRICSGAWTYAYAISCYVMKCSYSTCGSFGKRGSPSKSLSHAYGGVSLTESPGEKSPGLLYGAPIWRKKGATNRALC